MPGDEEAGKEGKKPTMEFADVIYWVLAAAEGKKMPPLIPHIYVIPIVFLIGAGVGYWFRGRKVG